MVDVIQATNSRAGIARSATERSTRRLARVACASAIGTTVEYYDFTLYATATALVFNRTFFVSSDPIVGSLAAFATFFVGYCARPLGGLIFGHFGDRVGRRKMLLLTVLIMGIGTFLVGLVPPYASIGIWAPVTLVILRLLQGIGLGGEYGGGMVMTIEHAPEKSRGFVSSLVHIGTPAGFLIPIALLGILGALMPDADFLSWGWRIPFMVSLVLVAVALFIRLQVEESPIFLEQAASAPPPAVPAAEAIRRHGRDIVLGVGAKIAESGLFNIYAVFSITYAVTVMHLPRTTVLNGILVGCALECLTLPLFGALSDRVGRKAVYIGGALFQAAFAFPFVLMLATGGSTATWIAVGIGLALGHGAMYGAQGALFAEMFPARVRYSGLSMVQQIGPILGGGLSPLIATSLVAAYGTIIPVGIYMAAASILSALCAIGLRRAPETAG
jgi:MFS family permease